MLRTITLRQFQELAIHDRLYPSGEVRMDIRFALLAAVIAGSVNAVDPATKRPYTAKHFLRAIRSIDEEPKVVSKQKPKQSLDMMKHLLNSWMDSSNAAFRAGKKIVAPKRKR